MVEEVNSIAEMAGKKILEVYGNTNLSANQKSDGSPITVADELAHQCISDGLKDLDATIPILSEEGDELLGRSTIKRLWVVDPLDGTKDFLAKNGEFTVNIALVENGLPTLGVIHIPVRGETFWAIKGKGAFRGQEKILNSRKGAIELVAAVSNFHLNDRTKEFLKQNGLSKTEKIGSSIKFCAFAEGKIDVYPRLAPTMEWDTAAGQIIAEEAGGQVVDLTTGDSLKYNKEELKNPPFILTRRDLNWKISL